jgi:hypothetical protein
MRGLAKALSGCGACAVLGFAAAAAAPASAGRSADGYPLEAVLTAARALCSVAPSARDLDRGPLPAGWKVVTPREGSWLAGYLTLNRSVTAGLRADPRALTATVRGRSLEAIVKTTTAPQLQRESGSCEVIDRQAVLSPDDERMGRWAARRPAVGRRDVLPGLSGWTWKPGLEPGSWESSVNYVTAPAAKAGGLRTGLTYLAITLSRQPTK